METLVRRFSTILLNFLISLGDDRERYIAHIAHRVLIQSSSMVKMIPRKKIGISIANARELSVLF
jgi:hypothetical protein